jgi:hypothetical protein
MNRQQILLALALSEGGVPLRVGQFDERLIIQKSVCLLQYAGVHLGYRFRWYLRGPYSTDLTSDAFWLAGRASDLPEELKGWRLDDESRDRINKLKGLFTGAPLTKLAKNLELLASALFIIRTGQAKPDDYARISELLNINDKPFSAAEVSKAMETLRKYGITA